MNTIILDRLIKEVYSDGYYHISEDIKDYPDAWLYVIWSLRGPGKTYSFLRYMIATETKFIYMKRTNDDIDLLCQRGYKGDQSYDPSPFKPINRDFNINIRPYKIREGLAGFYEFNSDGEPDGPLLGYALSLNAVAKYKGFDFSECDYICFDEFIPMKGQVVKHNEGTMLLNFYMTVCRDRVKRGRDDLKLVLLANADDIAVPTITELEIMDNIAVMNNTGRYIEYIEDRGIFLRHINADMIDNEYKNMGIYKAMSGTAWGDIAFTGTFANNDFSNVNRSNLKQYKCLIHLIYRRRDIYIYLNQNNGKWHFTSSKNNAVYFYDLDRENDQKRFYQEFGIDIRLACIENRVTFDKYSYYDMFINYKKYFELR